MRGATINSWLRHCLHYRHRLPDSASRMPTNSHCSNKMKRQKRQPNMQLKFSRTSCWN